LAGQLKSSFSASICSFPCVSCLTFNSFCSGNHERDWPGTGSFYGSNSSSGMRRIKACSGSASPTRRKTGGQEQSSTSSSSTSNACPTVDRQKQTWLVFLTHRVLSYSTCAHYKSEGTFEEFMGADVPRVLEPVRGHHYAGAFQATTHVVGGGAGASQSDFAAGPTNVQCSLTAFNHSSMLFQYKRSLHR
jgi:acid phosphatase type 7